MFKQHVIQIGVILCIEVRESPSLYIYFKFIFCFQRVFFFSTKPRVIFVEYLPFCNGYAHYILSSVNRGLKKKLH